MNIQISNDIPDGTYFTMSDVSPVLHDDQSITIYNGKGTRRGWGAPNVTSTVVIEETDFVAIHVGFSHKHRGGQGWFYFVVGVQKKWSQLTEEQQLKVLADWNTKTSYIDTEGFARRLEGVTKKSPSWAKFPGKLRSEKKTPESSKQTAYKLVKVLADGKMVSLYNGETEYQIGKRLAEKAQSDHNGGLYAYPAIDGMMKLWESKELVPVRCYEGVEKVAVLEVEISGTIITYGSKLAATYLRPVTVVSVFEVSNV